MDTYPEVAGDDRCGNWKLQSQRAVDLRSLIWLALLYFRQFPTKSVENIKGNPLRLIILESL